MKRILFLVVLSFSFVFANAQEAQLKIKIDSLERATVLLSSSLYHLVSYECKEISEKENIRYERPTSEDILEVKALVEENLGKPATGNILYHLDYSQLKHYADNEISQIFMY